LLLRIVADLALQIRSRQRSDSPRLIRFPAPPR